MGESTARGSGRNASGPLIATWQMLEWIRDNGPADRETIKDACAGMVDAGYARRWYRRRRLRPSEAKRRITPQQTSPAEDLAQIPALTAQRAKVGSLISTCVWTGTLTRDGDMFTWVKMPRMTPAGFAIEAVTSDERVMRRHVYERELVIQLRRANKRGALNPETSARRLLGKERDALFRWLSTFDDLDAEKIQVTGVELEAIVTLRDMRSRQARENAGEKKTIRALWLALDNFAQ